MEALDEGCSHSRNRPPDRAAADSFCGGAHPAEVCVASLRLMVRVAVSAQTAPVVWCYDGAPTKSHGGSKLGRLCRCARAPAQHHDPDVDAMEFGQAAQRLEQLEGLRPLDERTAGTRTVE